MNVLDVATTQISPSPDNPRRDLGDLDELVASIHAVGILEPLVVVPNGGEGYELVAGHRRLAAAEQAGLMFVPVVVAELDQEQRLEAALIENLQRTDLAPMEEASAFARLLELPGYTQTKIAERIGRNQAHISRRISLLKLPDQVRSAIDAGRVKLEVGVQLAQAVQRDEKVAGEISEVFDDVSDLEAEGEDLRANARVQDHLEWELERVARDSEHRAQREAHREELKAKGIRVWKAAPPKAVELNSWGELRHVNKVKHAKEPCHGVVVGASGDRAYCTKPANHPAPKQDPQARHRQPEQDPRQLALAQAAETRLGFVEQLFAAKHAPKELTDLVLKAVVFTDEVWGDEEIIARLLGVGESRKWGWLGTWVEEHPDRLLRAAGATAIASCEAGMEGGWDGTRWTEDKAITAYVAWLELNGYELSEAERTELGR